jgi:hypothetical protein
MSPKVHSTHWASSRVGAAGALALLLVACGGGQESTDFQGRQGAAQPAPRRDAADPASPTVAPSASTIAALQEGARLNTAELENIARTGVLPKAFDGPHLTGGTTASTPLAGARKRQPERVTVYRFFNQGTGAHFFTASESERDSVIATLPALMRYEGPAFHTADGHINGLSPVHRFQNTQTGVHFYTISEAERANVVAHLPQFAYEGIAYYASTLPGTGYTPLYRFLYTPAGFHFYTNSQAERDRIVATLPQYRYEGVGYHVLGDGWRMPAVPHTGVTSAQCYRAGSDALVACTTPEARALSPRQDGHRSSVNPMSYSQFTRNSGGSPVTYPTTDCVVDNVTGLIWEGKTASGTRAGLNTYSNFGDGRVGDASAYVDSVNARNVCGFSDWRLPTVEELQGLVDHGTTSAPRITTAMFPNTAANDHWTSQVYVAPFGGATDQAWVVAFNSGNSGALPRSDLRAVRLVHGAIWSAPRYMVASASYAGDSTNNAVIDRKTGLMWRRCQEGLLWNGSACTGTTLALGQQAALAHALGKPGWRLPNAKELGTLVDLTQSAPPKMNNEFFSAVPGAASNYWSWSSTPYVDASNQAWFTWFYFGTVGNVARSNVHSVRLVLDGI